MKRLYEQLEEIAKRLASHSPKDWDHAYQALVLKGKSPLFQRKVLIEDVAAGITRVEFKKISKRAFLNIIQFGEKINLFDTKNCGFHASAKDLHEVGIFENFLRQMISMTLKNNGVGSIGELITSIDKINPPALTDSMTIYEVISKKAGGIFKLKEGDFLKILNLMVDLGALKSSSKKIYSKKQK